LSEPGAFDVTVTVLGAGRSLVRVQGEVDLATAPELEATLAEQRSGDRVVLDLTDCSFLDSSAIRVVLTSAERAQST
jgi:anti-sigma B factor antagonist